jgi:6-phosphogluconolactonase
MAVSPDGGYLVAAIHGGGAYNILPISADGSIGPVSQILKEIGNGTHPLYQASAHPHSILFDPTGRYLLGTDEGCDRINCFAFENGGITRTTQALSRPVSGPGHLAMHPSSRFFYAANTLDGSIDCYRCSAGAHEMHHEQRVTTNKKTEQQEEQQLVISSSGRVLYAASRDNISVWEIDSRTGELSFMQRWVQMNRRLRALMLSPDDRRLLVADEDQNELLSVSVDMERGKLGEALPMARIAGLRSLAVKYI